MALLGWLVMLPGLAAAESKEQKWEPCGWGGGGWNAAAVFHPTQDGVIYLGEDVGGVCKTTDHGLNWRRINNGLTNYAVFSLAVDRSNPETVYAGTVGGLHKSTDGGEHWRLLPHTGRNELRITSETNASIRSIAVDPVNGNNLYAASPGGKIYKSTNAGETWKTAYEKQNKEEEPDILSIQFGKVNGAYFGDLWLPLAFPTGVKPEKCVGFGFTFKGDKTQPKQAFLVLKQADGITYRSKNLNDRFMADQWQDVILSGKDFAIDSDFAKSNPDKAKAASATPDFSSVNRVDFSCSGNLPAEASLVKIRQFFYAVTRTPDGKTGTAEKPVLLKARDFSTDKMVQTIGNLYLGGALPGPAHAVAVAAKNPSLVVAATDDSGLVLSQDAGQTWQELNTPKRASSAVFSETDPNIIYGSFYTDGIWKSTDKGKTWIQVSEGFRPKSSMREVAVSPANPLDVFALEFGAGVYRSNDGGASWTGPFRLAVDLEGNPTLHYDAGTNRTQQIAHPSNITINPLNSKEVFISSDWRSAWSNDGGLTWSERERGADITCTTDIRFSKGRVYVTAMDEGTLVSENNGKRWRQLWPLIFSPALSGHYWRVTVNHINGVDHIVSTMSPWNSPLRHVVYSEDGGKTFKDTTSGLPDYLVTANTMWGQGHPRALAADPKDPKVFYLGLDGDATAGKSGGGIFKSEDGGIHWKQLLNQPACRRMYNALAVDPTDSKRLFWGACGKAGGVYRSENGGDSWANVFNKEDWIFNILVTKAGDIYALGHNLWRSTDHGKTWNQLTKFQGKRSLCGIEVDPRNAKTIWISAVTWDGSTDGAVYKTTDEGLTWQDITGNLNYVKPQVLRFNPETNELWAGWVGLSKIKQ